MRLFFPVPFNCRRTFNSHCCLERATINWMNKFQGEQRATAPPAGCYFTRQVPLFLCDWTCRASLTSNLACLCPVVARCAETLALTGPNTCRKKNPTGVRYWQKMVELLWPCWPKKTTDEERTEADRRSHTGHWAVGWRSCRYTEVKGRNVCVTITVAARSVDPGGAASFKLGPASAFLRKTTWRITHGSHVKQMCGGQKLHYYCNCVTIWKKVPL